MALPMRARGARREVAVVVAALGAALLAGLLAIAKVDEIGPLSHGPLSKVTTLPLPVYPVMVVALAVLVLASRHWWLGLTIFFGWLPFEDLVRKLAGNDLRVYFVKDVLLLLAMVGVAPRLKGCWREPLGNVWLPTMAVFLVALAFSLPSALVSPALPVVEFHVRFLYAVLFPVGVYLAQDGERLRKAMMSLAVLGGVVCGLGIAQSIIGPTFLNPATPEAQLAHLIVIKGYGATEVVRPSGPFADVSRFASMTIVALTLGFCSFRLADTTRRRQISAVTIVVALSAAFASGSRTALLVCVPLTVFGLLFPERRNRRSSRAAVLVFVGAVVVGVVAFGGAVGKESSQRSGFYASTLNPTSAEFEFGSRLHAYGLGAIGGIQSGGFVGRGTGTESGGTQYLNVQVDSSHTESGWGTVGAEWGVAGLAVWVLWVFAWTRRAISEARSKRTTPGSPAAPIIAFYVAALLIVMFSLGTGTFDNYIGNVFFWLLSGVAFAGTRSARQELDG